MALEDELVTLRSLADEHGVAYNTAWRWSRREDFPTPAATFAGRPVWRRAATAKWTRENLPLKPGPPPRR